MASLCLARNARVRDLGVDVFGPPLLFGGNAGVKWRDEGLFLRLRAYLRGKHIKNRAVVYTLALRR